MRVDQAASAGSRIPLALPRLGPAVPRKVVPGRLGAANAAITRFLLDARAFDELDAPASFDDSLRGCEQSLSRWIARQIGPLRCLRPSFHMQVLDSHGNYLIWSPSSNTSNSTRPRGGVAQVCCCDDGSD